MVTMKKALVLAGGGTKGAYQAGAIRALCEMGMDDWDIVTGTSVGSMHAALVVQKDYDYLYGIYDRLKKEEIFNGTLPVNLGLEELIGERNCLPNGTKRKIVFSIFSCGCKRTNLSTSIQGAKIVISME